MLDIVLFREKDEGGDPELVRESQRRRFAPTEVVDEVQNLDKEVRKLQYELEQGNRNVNSLSKQIGAKKKAKEDASELIQQVQAIKKQKGELTKKIAEMNETIQAKIAEIGNIVHDSVPVSDNEDNNGIVRTWGERQTEGEIWHHHELLYMIDGYDFAAGSEVAGHRGYYLKGNGVLLNMALIQYGLNFLTKKGYSPITTPYFMKKEIMGKVAQLSDYDESLYHVQGSGNDEFYLIATSEQPLAAFHMKKWIAPSTLPHRYAGYSTCFRKEAGKAGKDNWGIFRVHQFDKVEQFVVTSPETSWEEHENMLKCSEEFLQSLQIPYRVVNIVSGELNNAAAKKYDVEGWYPGFQEYKELVSCSNCTDYQSRRLETRFGTSGRGKNQGENRDKKEYCHMLNSTLCATSRVLSVLLELNQTEEGIVVPEVLRPYMGGLELIPFVNPPQKKWKKTNLSNIVGEK